MNDISINKVDDLWGITENSDVLVPHVWESKIEAIAEWKYFEVLNLSQPFLKRQKSLYEIEKIEQQLLR